MDSKKIERINELYKLSQQRKLTKEELDEQIKLREEYRRGFVNNLKSQLENTIIINPDGTNEKVSDKKKNKGDKK